MAAACDDNDRTMTILTPNFRKSPCSYSVRCSFGEPDWRIASELTQFPADAHAIREAAIKQGNAFDPTAPGR